MLILSEAIEIKKSQQAFVALKYLLELCTNSKPRHLSQDAQDGEDDETKQKLAKIYLKKA